MRESLIAQAPTVPTDKFALRQLFSKIARTSQSKINLMIVFYIFQNAISDIITCDRLRSFADGTPYCTSRIRLDRMDAQWTEHFQSIVEFLKISSNLCKFHLYSSFAGGNRSSKS